VLLIGKERGGGEGVFVTRGHQTEPRLPIREVDARGMKRNLFSLDPIEGKGGEENNLKLSTLKKGEKKVWFFWG